VAGKSAQTRDRRGAPSGPLWQGNFTRRGGRARDGGQVLGRLIWLLLLLLG
jgi:hypothetical protein